LLWKYINAIEKDIVHDKELRIPYHLDNTQIVRLPLIQNANELDQWITSELHQMMKELNESLGSFELELATKILLSFVEKLTNRYVRRSRRRFWASGMEDDKVAAYTTLREVLETFLQCAAPFAPFITEKIWLEMQAMRIQQGLK
jgi:isoleucyl-tRNA synthetase